MKILIVTGRPRRRFSEPFRKMLQHLEHAGWHAEIVDLPSFLAAPPPRMNDADDIAVAGGDGTIRACLTRVESFPVLLVPTGTGNDLARSLDILTVTDAARALRCGQRRRIDLLSVRHDGVEEAAANGVGIGLDGAVARLRGRGLPYAAAAIAALAARPVVSARVSTDGGPSTEETFLSLLVANGSYFGGGFRLAPAARLDDGLLEVVAIAPVSLGRALRSLGKAREGRHVEDPAVSCRQARSVVVESGRPFDWHLDGEVRTSSRIEIGIRPAAATFYDLTPP